MDDLEMQADIQAKITELWPLVTSENLDKMTDVKGYCTDFYRLFGFDIEGIDYNADLEPGVKIPSLGDVA
jgi:enoyl-[acyl-carrier protein] reductase/trans-2-enoyl-CoA reductase (NAD+)